jgi:hypothetical protein
VGSFWSNLHPYDVTDATRGLNASLYGPQHLIPLGLWSKVRLWRYFEEIPRLAENHRWINHIADAIVKEE